MFDNNLHMYAKHRSPEEVLGMYTYLYGMDTAALSVSLVLLTASQSSGQQASQLQASMLMWQCSVTVTTAGTRKIKGFRDVFMQEWHKEFS